MGWAPMNFTWGMPCGYAMRRGIFLCLDTGHCHPTEVASDKLSAVLLYLDRVLLHLSRGVRWDSDHVVTLTDDLQMIAITMTLSRVNAQLTGEDE